MPYAANAAGKRRQSMNKMNSTGSVPFRYIMLPEFILQDETISDGAKLLFGITTALSSREGYCFCTNRHLSAMLRKSTRSITRLIGELKDRSYITVENAAAEIGEVQERRIRPDISNPTVRSFLGRYRNFCLGDTDKSVSRRDDKTGEDNNINNNNNNNINIINNLSLTDIKNLYGIKLTESEYSSLKDKHDEKMIIDAMSEYSAWKKKKNAHPWSDYETLCKWLVNSKSPKERRPGRSQQETEGMRASREELEKFDSLTRSGREK